MKTKAENVRVPFFRHDLGRAELESVARVFKGPILTTGEAVAEFETRFAARLERRACVAVSSCTAAMQLSLTALGVGPGDEVITTPMTFAATPLSILQAGAKPVFADIEESTGHLDLECVKRAIGPKTRAILPVHLYGQMSDMRALRALADRHGLKLVEDAAHCIEGKRDGARPGALSHAACFSFFATKNITCGEGGAVVTDDEALGEELRKLRHHGMTKTSADREREGYRHWDIETFGWKYNMDNIHAAILLPQLGRLSENLEKRKRLWRRYEERLSGLAGVRRLRFVAGAEQAHHLYPIWVEPGVRDKLVAYLERRGIRTVVNYRAVPLLKYFAKTLGHRKGDFPVAERFGEGEITLPLYPAMPDGHVDLVAEALEAFFR